MVVFVSPMREPWGDVANESSGLAATCGMRCPAATVFGQLLFARIIEPTSKLGILVTPGHVLVPTFG
jgi:hypothetical protein